MQVATCVFCNIAMHKEPANIVYEDRDVMVFLDKSPQTRGHMQLIPKAHYRWIYDVPDMGKLFTTAQTIIRVIIPILGADHVSIHVYGVQILHAHIWLVPQYGRGISVHEEASGASIKININDTARVLRNALAKEVS